MITTDELKALPLLINVFAEQSQSGQRACANEQHKRKKAIGSTVEHMMIECHLRKDYFKSNYFCNFCILSIWIKRLKKRQKKRWKGCKSNPLILSSSHSKSDSISNQYQYQYWLCQRALVLFIFYSHPSVSHLFSLFYTWIHFSLLLLLLDICIGSSKSRCSSLALEKT